MLATTSVIYGDVMNEERYRHHTRTVFEAARFSNQVTCYSRY